MFRNRPVSLALVGLFVLTTACTSYKQIEPREVADYGKARVTLEDGSRVAVAQPQIAADTLVGFEADSWSAADRVYTYRVRVALDQVATVEASHTSASRTALAAMGGLLVVLTIAYAIDCANNPDSLGC